MVDEVVKSKRKYTKSKQLDELCTKTISIRVTEAQFNVYKNNKGMRKVIGKYIRACLDVFIR